MNITLQDKNRIERTILTALKTGFEVDVGTTIKNIADDTPNDLLAWLANNMQHESLVREYAEQYTLDKAVSLAQQQVWRGYAHQLEMGYMRRVYLIPKAVNEVTGTKLNVRERQWIAEKVATEWKSQDLLQSGDYEDGAVEYLLRWLLQHPAALDEVIEQEDLPLEKALAVVQGKWRSDYAKKVNEYMEQNK